LLGLGLSLTWGLLRVINLANFALAFLGAYLTYPLATTLRLDPILTLVAIVPAFFVVGIVLEAGFLRFRIDELTSLIVTFGLSVILESLSTIALNTRLDGGPGVFLAAVHAPTLFGTPATMLYHLALAVALRRSRRSRSIGRAGPPDREPRSRPYLSDPALVPPAHRGRQRRARGHVRRRPRPRGRTQPGALLARVHRPRGQGRRAPRRAESPGA
jgi:hypothetical protein